MVLTPVDKVKQSSVKTTFIITAGLQIRILLLALFFSAFFNIKNGFSQKRAVLNANQVAPDFVVEDVFGTSVNLKAYHGKKVILSFYRFATCPLCNLRVLKLIEQHNAKYKDKGIVVIAVFEDTRENILQYVAKESMPLVIIADNNKTLFKLYGVESNKRKAIRNFLFNKEVKKQRKEIKSRNITVKPTKNVNQGRIPADFLIDTQEKIAVAHYGKHVGDHISFEKINTFVE